MSAGEVLVWSYCNLHFAKRMDAAIAFLQLLLPLCCCCCLAVVDAAGATAVLLLLREQLLLRELLLQLLCCLADWLAQRKEEGRD